MRFFLSRIRQTGSYSGFDAKTRATIESRPLSRIQVFGGISITGNKSGVPDCM